MDSPPSPKAGTSSLSSASSDSFRVDISRLVGKEEAPRFAKLLKVNKLKLIPIDFVGVDPSVLRQNKENYAKLKSEIMEIRASFICCNNKLEKTNSKMLEKEAQAKYLQEEVSKFEALLAVRGQRLEEVDRKVVGMGIATDLFQDIILYLLEEEDKTKLNINSLNKELEEAKKKLQVEATKQNVKYEKTVKILRSQLKQTKNIILEINSANGKLSLENAQLSRKLQEQSETLKASFLTERSRRLNEIIALKEEKERMTVQQCTLMGFIRRLKEKSDFPFQNENESDDLFSVNSLERLFNHVNEILQAKNEETSELNRNRELMQQMEVLFLRARQSENNASFPEEEELDNRICEESIMNNNTIASQPQSTSPIANGSPPASPNNASMTSQVRAAEHLPSTKARKSASAQGKEARNIAVPKVETDPYDISAEFGAEPSITIPLLQSAITPQRLSPPPVSPAKKIVRSARSRPLRNDKQFTPYAVTSKAHGVNKASAQFRCLCGNVYANEKGLNVHIRKMTTEWKYKCKNCLQYFFHQSELNRHVTTSKCRVGGTQNVPSANEETNGQGIQANSILKDLLFPQPEQQKRVQDGTSSSISLSNSKKGKVNKRLLQQKFLKGKQHGPWLSKKGTGTVQGRWYCKCGSKFASKKHLQTHTYYFTLDWKFKCSIGDCQQKFYSLGYLKSHMSKNHKMTNPLSKYSTGCNFCGKMFVKRSDMYMHRKKVHNLHKAPNDHCNFGKSRGAPLQKTSAQVRASSASSSSPPQTPCEAVIVLPTPVKNVEFIDLTFEDQDDDQDEAASSGETSLVKNLPKAGAGVSTVNFSTPLSPSRSSISGPQGRERHGAVDIKCDLNSFHDNKSSHLCICECGKKYKSRNALLRHIKIEKYGKMYACKECSRRFNELSTLKGHMFSIHVKSFNGFNCGLCKKPFMTSKEFSKHRLAEHQHV